MLFFFSSPLPPGVAAFIPQSVTNCHIYGIAIGSENNVLFLAWVILSIIAWLFLLTIIFAIVCCYRKYWYKIRPYLKRGLIVLVGIVVLAVIIYVPKLVDASLILSVKEVTVGQIATNTSPQQATEDILYNSWGPYDYNKNGAVDQN